MVAAPRPTHGHRNGVDLRSGCRTIIRRRRGASGGTYSRICCLTSDLIVHPPLPINDTSFDNLGSTTPEQQAQVYTAPMVMRSEEEVALHFG
eukprot:10892806-Prorocentrum_lima.AAC.1